MCQHVAAQVVQDVRVVGADVEHRRLLFQREGVEPHGKHAQPAGAARGFVVTGRIGIEAGRGVGIHLPHVMTVGVIMPLAAAQQHIARGVAAFLQIGQDFFRRVAQRNAQVIDQLQLAAGIELCVQRHLRVGRAPLHQCAARVVADAPDHRSTDAGRADHRMRLASVLLQQHFQCVQRGAGQTDHLFRPVEQLDAVHAQGVDDDDVAFVIVSAGGGTAGQPRVGGLADDDGIACHTDLQYPPVFEQCARLHHRQRLATAETVAGAEGFGACRAGEYVLGADHLLQAGHESGGKTGRHDDGQ